MITSSIGRKKSGPKAPIIFHSGTKSLAGDRCGRRVMRAGFILPVSLLVLHSWAIWKARSLLATGSRIVWRCEMGFFPPN